MPKGPRCTNRRLLRKQQHIYTNSTQNGNKGKDTSRHEWERQYRKEKRGVGSMEQNITPSAHNRKIVKQENENGKKIWKNRTDHRWVKHRMPRELSNQIHNTHIKS